VSIGLIALLDDVAALAKVAAASLDDVAGQASRAGAKAAGIVIDDAAVTPRYVVGFAASRELPIVGKIAVGSLKNKLLYLLPAALVLSLVAPWIITPLLMLGGCYLAYEGTEKICEALWPDPAHHHETATRARIEDPRRQEEARVRAAISTDFILSAEIMAVTLATLPDAGLLTEAAVLATVGIALTVIVYGGVAVIVKTDDIGVALARNDAPVSALFGRGGAGVSRADRMLRPLSQGLGRGLVRGMPVFLRVLSIVGTAAMVWVGGGIIIHGLETLGLPGLARGMEHAAEAVAHVLPAGGRAAAWGVTAVASGIVGLLAGAALLPLMEHAITPVFDRIAGLLGSRD